MHSAVDVLDLRFGQIELPTAGPGFAPAADALALMSPTVASPARTAVPGVQYTGSYAPGERFVVRVPTAWNGALIVAGTPATRSEFSNDLIWGEFALAGGYAFAAGNKGVPYNVISEPAQTIAGRSRAYPVPFGAGGLLTAGLAFGLGMLWPQRITIDAWNADYRALVVFARDLLAARHRAPRRVYAVGVSNGGAQVRTLLEQSPELVDGGVEWAGVYWTAEHNLLDILPPFLQAMPGYIAGGFRDSAVVERLVQAGFPADVVAADPDHPSLYAEFYSNVAPFYADLTVFAYGLLIDPLAASNYGDPACLADPIDPRLPGICQGSGLALPANRASYAPSPAARTRIAAFAHTGTIGKPLVSIAGTHDVFITPAHHALGYARAVSCAGRAHLHELYLVAGGTHVDAFTTFGYGLQAQAPFAWAAFDKLVRSVERGDILDGRIRTVSAPNDVA